MNRKYNEEHVAWLAANISGCHFKDLTAMFNERFGFALSVPAMVSLADRHGLHNGIDTRLNNTWLGQVGVPHQFHKGFIPWNKGQKGINYPGMAATQFKKGQKAANWMPVGSERVNADGYVDVKIQDGQLQKNWKGKHIMIWEAAHGPVPPSHCLIFADRNKLNVTLENLILVSRKQLVRLNQNHLIQDDAELTKVGITIADISNKIGERKRKQKTRGNGRRRGRCSGEEVNK